MSAPEWEIYELWQKYEKVAMHFNDLIIRLRTQALAGVAALSALTGFFAKADFGALSHSWLIAGVVFGGLAFVWIAVWILDFGYYNRLLIGSIAAIVVLEERSKTHKTISAIQLSTLVEDAVANKPLPRRLTPRDKFNIVIARWTFYSMILAALAVGALFCFWMYCHLEPPSHNGIG